MVNESRRIPPMRWVMRGEGREARVTRLINKPSNSASGGVAASRNLRNAGLKMMSIRQTGNRNQRYRSNKEKMGWRIAYCVLCKT